MAAIDRRIQRLDRASTHGAWTRLTLHPESLGSGGGPVN